jgi:hypothetical protein
MDEAKELLDILVRARRRIKDLAIKLRQSFPAASVTHEIDFIPLNGKPSVGLFIELNRSAGEYLCWWVDVYFDQGWQIEVTLWRDDGDCERAVWESTARASTIDELGQRLSEALDKIEKDDSPVWFMAKSG